jgi:hypothetical protein
MTCMVSLYGSRMSKWKKGKVCTRTLATFSRYFGQNHDMTLHSKPRFQPSSNSSGLTAQGPPDWFVPCRTDKGRNLATLYSSTKNNSSSRFPTKWVLFPFPVFFHIQLWWQILWHFNLQGKLNSSAAQSFLKWVFCFLWFPGGWESLRTWW